MNSLSGLRFALIVVIYWMSGLVALEARTLIDTVSYVSSQPSKGSFTLAASGKTASLYVSSQDFPGVIRAVKSLQADIRNVTKVEPTVASDKIPSAKEIVLVGTIGKSAVIDQLIKQKKLDVTGVAGKWETFIVQVVEKPMRGVDRALVIAGSDKRGTIYGVYDLSAQIGVSPWYWWADVPVKQQQNLYVLPGQHTQGEPVVKYRGIFINDEAPALSGWTREKFGGFNHQLYENVFELILRMKGNYLWPAMWGNAFYADDSLNPKLAHEYGVVIGTSHHEPLMRAHDEWRRNGGGPWNYNTNEENLKKFWASSIKRMGSNESIISLGMRGDGDEPMTQGTAISLLEKIVTDQREIIHDVTGKELSTVPQSWALYKEVQDYYDKGMRVPDDVTLLLCDDNWGNIRKLPKANEKQHSGSYGIYYHFDYVGGPRNYKWLNTNPIPRVWEQMHLAYRYNANRIWIVNVGDIKPMEFPIEFFLDYAWNPEKWPSDKIDDYTRWWAKKQFGEKHAVAIADILAKYGKYNGRRKPELLAPDTYSLFNYQEAETVVADYNKLAEDAEKIYNDLPAEYKDAFYQLVLYPTKACANMNDMYVAVGKNRLYAAQGRAATSEFAEKAKILYAKDAELSDYYNKTMAGGKWNHMMDQIHIGYTYWQQPRQSSMPEVKSIELPAAPDMGVSIEGSDAWWPKETAEALLPEFNPFQKSAHYFEIFNRGQGSFDYSIEAGAPWIQITPSKGNVEKEQRLWINVDWQMAPTGKQRAPITVTGANGSKVVITIAINNPASLKPESVIGFVENNGYVSMEAIHYTKAVETSGITWQQLPDLGRTLSAVTPFPVTAPRQSPGGDSPRLEYAIHVADTGEVKVNLYFSPTLSFNANEGLSYGVSIDDEKPQIINANSDNSNRTWERWVANNIIITTTKHKLTTPGQHVLKFWMVDPGLVLQKIVIDRGGVKPSYLGPPESYYRTAISK